MTAPVHKPWALKSIFTRSKDAKNVHTPQCGDIIQLDGFGGSFELTDGHNATLEDLVNISVGGVVLFTYPKANTPGLSRIRPTRTSSSVLGSHPKLVGTAQACLFRDSYQELRALGFAVYGLSRDTLKANTQFKLKNELPFSLICDADGSLIDALGFQRPSKGTLRGVVVIDKDGRILASMKGTPNATVHAVHGVCERTSEPSSPSITMHESFLGANEMANVLQTIGNEDKERIAETVTTVANRVNVAAERMDALAGHV